MQFNKQDEMFFPYITLLLKYKNGNILNWILYEHALLVKQILHNK